MLVLFSETPATSGIWSGVLWHSFDLQRGESPWGTGEALWALSLSIRADTYGHSGTAVSEMGKRPCRMSIRGWRAAGSADALFPFNVDTLVTLRMAAYHGKPFIRVIDSAGMVIQAEGDSSRKCVVGWGVQANVIPPLNQPAICWVTLTPPPHTPPSSVSYCSHHFSLLLCQWPLEIKAAHYCIINSRWNDSVVHLRAAFIINNVSARSLFRSNLIDFLLSVVT